MSSISVSRARAELPALLDRVRAGEEITITRHGEAVAVMVRPDALRTRREGDGALAAARLREALEAARAEVLPAASGLSVERADELVADVRAGRAAH